MNLEIVQYEKQRISWPQSGKHIMAQFDEESIFVYQSYRPEIGEFAAKNQFFGGAFSYSRMSWIKPNFLWMMYRNGWGTKPGQEVTLAIKLKRSFFTDILNNAFPSSNYIGMESSEFKEQVKTTNVRLQWDPDHCPYGHKLERRAIQLGLRNDFLLPFKGDGIIEIIDISSFVKEQKEHVNAQRLDLLQTPKEDTFPSDFKY